MHIIPFTKIEERYFADICWLILSHQANQIGTSEWLKEGDEGEGDDVEDVVTDVIGGDEPVVNSDAEDEDEDEWDERDDWEVNNIYIVLKKSSVSNS